MAVSHLIMSIMSQTARQTTVTRVIEKRSRYCHKCQDDIEAVRPEGFPFLFRANIVGKVHWNCPECGRLNNTRNNWTKPFARCTNDRCQSKWAVGLIFHRVPERGRTDIHPEDWPAYVENVERTRRPLEPVDPMVRQELSDIYWRGGDATSMTVSSPDDL